MLFLKLEFNRVVSREKVENRKLKERQSEVSTLHKNLNGIKTSQIIFNKPIHFGQAKCKMVK